MTVPGVRVTSVRRTVRVAVALVTGQALLCGIIGIVTFAGRDASGPGASAAEPQLAGPPAVVPTTSAPTTGRPAQRPEPGSTRSGRLLRPTSPPAPVQVRSSAVPTAKPSSPAAPAPRARIPAPATSPPDLGLLPPSPAPEDGPPTPVAEWERCDDEGALGRTAGGEVVRCERGRRDGELRWRRV